MALRPPVNIPGVEPDTSFFSKTATFDASPNTPVISPIPGSVTEFEPNNKTIVIKSPEGSEIKFEKMGSFTAGLSVGSNINIGSQIGYTGNDKLEFTAFNKKGTKINPVDFLKNTDPATLAMGAAGLTGKDKGTTDGGAKLGSTSYSPKPPSKNIKDYALVRAVTGVGLLPHKLMGKAFGVNENEEERNNLINEEIERIKKLMK